MSDQTPDLAALEALAEAATPGPWEAQPYTEIDGDGSYDLAHVTAPDPDEPETAVLGVAMGILRPDAAFIAAADPTTVLWLIREVERLQYVVSEAQTDLDNEREYRDLDDQTAEMRADVIREEWQIARARAEKAEATIERVRAALANHPRACEAHPDEDPISCGWKRAVLDVQTALDGGESR